MDTDQEKKRQFLPAKYEAKFQKNHHDFIWQPEATVMPIGSSTVISEKQKYKGEKILNSKEFCIV